MNKIIMHDNFLTYTMKDIFLIELLYDAYRTNDISYQLPYMVFNKKGHFIRNFKDVWIIFQIEQNNALKFCTSKLSSLMRGKNLEIDISDKYIPYYKVTQYGLTYNLTFSSEDWQIIEMYANAFPKITLGEMFMEQPSESEINIWLSKPDIGARQIADSLAAINAYRQLQN